MKICIVGLGARISNVARLLAKAIPDAEFSAYCDPTPAGLEALAAATGNRLTAYEIPSDMLSREKPDLVMVGSPNFLHLDHLGAALRSDVPRIFTEKPVVISEDETFDLLGLMRDHDGLDRMIVGLVLRYSPLYRALRESVGAGQLGDIVSIEATEHIGPYHGAFFMRDWRRHTRLSGGFMLEKCCHDLDLYNGVAGARPMQIASFGGRKSFVPENAPPSGHVLPVPPRFAGDVSPFVPRWGGTDDAFNSDGDIVDYQTALVNYANGVNLCFHTNLNVPDDYRRFAVFGTRGMAEGDFNRNYYRVHDALTSEKLVDRNDLDTVGSDHKVSDHAMARDLARHFETGSELPVGVLDALVAGLTAMKMNEARLSKSVVDLTGTWEKFDSYGLTDG